MHFIMKQTKIADQSISIDSRSLYLTSFGESAECDELHTWNECGLKVLSVLPIVLLPLHCVRPIQAY